MLQRIAATQWRVLFVVVALSVTIPFILWCAGVFWLGARWPQAPIPIVSIQSSAFDKPLLFHLAVLALRRKACC